MNTHNRVCPHNPRHDNGDVYSLVLYTRISIANNSAMTPRKHDNDDALARSYEFAVPTSAGPANTRGNRSPVNPQCDSRTTWASARVCMSNSAGQYLAFSANGDMQAGVVDLVIANPIEHGHALMF